MNMKGITLLYTLLVCTAAVLAFVNEGQDQGGKKFLPNGCPVDPHIHWLLPHEEECTLFYYCVWGELVLRECSPGTHFNSLLQVCDWPHDAGCTKTPNPTRPEPTTPEPTIPEPTTPEPTTPEPTTPEPTTPEPTTSKPTTIKPTTPEPTTPAPTPEETAATTAAPTPAPPTEFLPNGCPVDPHIHWLLPHEEECTLFYYCVWGELVLRECSPGTHFNSVLQVCDWPYDAGCTKTPKPTEPEPTTPEPTTPEPTTPEPITSEPTTPKPTSEPTTLAPTPEQTAATTAAPTPAPPTEFLPNGCPVDPHIHWLLPHEEECTLFYYCVWGELVLRECSPGTHFNSVLQVCDWPHDAGCTKTPNPTRPEPTTPEPTTPEPTTPEPTTPEPTTPEPTTPEPTTSKPTTIKPTTPEPTTPAPTPEETAATTAAPTPAPPTEFLPNGCPVDPHIHWLLPHEEECTLFYYCVWGELVLRECSPGTHFNSVLQVCDWPHDAGCTKTPNPTRPELSTPEPTTPEPKTPEPTTLEPTTSEPTTIKPTTPEPTTPAPTPEPTATPTATPTPAPPTEFLPNGCPVDPHIHWLLPHEEECTLFYYCVWGELLLRECSPGTHFNSVLQVCDWPYDAGCTKTPKPTEPEPTTPEPTTPEPTTPEPITSEPTTPKPTSEPTTLAPTPEQTAATTAAPTPAPPTEFLPNGCPVDPHIHWLLPHEEECTLFYYCVWGELVLRECSPGTHFNSVLQVCDWPHDAGCTKTPNPTRPEPTTPEPTTPEPTTPEPTTPEPTTPEPTTPEPTTSKPTTIKPTTPEPTTPAPTPEETAATTAAPTPAPPTEFLPNGCPVDPHIHWLLPHEEECTLFYYCVWGELVLRECSPGTHFNSVLQVCDWPHDAGCTKTPNPTRPELSTPEPTTPEPKTPEPTTLEPTTSEPTTIKPTTPEPTTPAPTPEPTATPTATPTPAPPTEFLPNGCPVDPHIHWLLPHEEECTLFYYCVWGELLLRECSPGTHFNSVLQVCDWPYDAGCTKAPKPTEPEPTTPEPTTPEPITSEPTTPKPTTPEPTTPALTIEPTATPTTTPTPAPPTEFLPNGCPVDPHIHWLLPHEEECTLFYYCFWGELVLRECSPGTHFNSVLQICDWPHDAGCTTALNKHINDTHTLLSA